MPFLPPGLLAGTEKTLNRLLARDPAAPGRLAALAGQRLALRLTRPALTLAIDFNENGLALSRPCDEAASQRADTRVELDAEALGALAGGASVQSLLTDHRLIVKGDLGLLPKTHALVTDLDIDLEGALAPLLGETPAYGLVAGLRRLGRAGRHFSSHFERDLRDYMVEEGEWLTGRDRLELAREELTALAIETDRLEARTKRLERRCGEGAS